MRILHIIPTLGCGGAETLVCNLAIQQAKIGHNVKIVLLEPLHYTFENFISKNELLRLVSIEKISTQIQFSFLKKSVKLSNDEFDEIISNFSPHVIHSHLFQAELVSRFKIYENVKYVSHCHNNMVQFDLWNKKTFVRRLTDYLEIKWLLKQYKKANNIFITISKNTEYYFKKRLPKSFINQVTFLPNAINSSLYFKAEKLDNSITKLITVGNLLENKGHLFLIEVVSELKKMDFNIQLEILGFGVMETILKTKIEELQLSENVFLRGSVSDVNVYLSSADIYIHGAFKEAFGLVLIEAMASSLSVVSTAGGGNNELIIEGYNGFLILNRDLNLFIEKVKYLIDNISERIRIGGNAKEYSKDYDIKSYTEKLIQLYKGNH